MNGVATYGHWGRPVLAFPAERGDAGEFERRGMVAAVGDLLAAGRVKLYCVDSFDGESWSNRSIPLEERARRHQFYESWILGEVVPFIRDDCAGAAEVITCGCSLGAYHAANFALKRADVFPLAICMSGSYDPAAWDGWGERGENAYFNNPMDYVSHLKATTSTGCARSSACYWCVGRGNGRTPPARWSPRAGSPGCCSPSGLHRFKSPRPARSAWTVFAGK